jgi:hypothetical protein
MNRPSIASLALLSSALLASCALPKNHSQVLHGDVRGGDVPLYMMGSLPDFSNAGLILGRYIRTEYDVLDLDSNGFLCTSWKNENPPLAQVAIPRLVTSIDIPGHFEVRYALPSDESDAQGPSIAYNDPSAPSSASGPHAPPSSFSLPGTSSFSEQVRLSSFFDIVNPATPVN